VRRPRIPRTQLPYHHHHPPYPLVPFLPAVHVDVHGAARAHGCGTYLVRRPPGLGSLLLRLARRVHPLARICGVAGGRLDAIFETGEMDVVRQRKYVRRVGTQRAMPRGRRRPGRKTPCRQTRATCTTGMCFPVPVSNPHTRPSISFNFEITHHQLISIGTPPPRTHRRTPAPTAARSPGTARVRTPTPPAHARASPRASPKVAV
jgi:hypothetical protein